MDYAPEPSASQLDALGQELGVVTVSFSRRILGGLGATTDVLSVDGRLVVLRRHGPWWPSAGVDVAARERNALTEASRAGLPVPDVLWAAADGLFGGPAVLLEYIDGRPLLTPRDPNDWADQLASALATLHAITPTDELRPVLAPPDSDQYRSDDFFDHPDARRVSERLESLRPLLDGSELALIHGDYWPGNTLWRGEQLVGIIDWENAAYSDPVADIAYCMLDLMYLGQEGAADRLVDTYRSLTGRSLQTLPYWRLLALSRPMPDIGQWVPAWEHLGYPAMTVEVARARHRELIAQELGD